MNTCTPWAALLDDYIDGVLCPDEQIALEQHLESCPHCAQYVADIRAIEAEFPTVDDVALPPDFTQSVMAQVAKHPRKTKKTIQWKRFALPAVACLAVVIYAGGDLPTHQSTEPTPVVTTYTAQPEGNMADMAQERAVAHVGDQTAVEEYIYSAQEIGDLLAHHTPNHLDDGTLGYSLSQADFLALMAQIDPERTIQEELVTYWLVVTP